MLVFHFLFLLFLITLVYKNTSEWKKNCPYICRFYLFSSINEKTIKKSFENKEDLNNTGVYGGFNKKKRKKEKI